MQPGVGQRAGPHRSPQPKRHVRALWLKKLRGERATYGEQRASLRILRRLIKKNRDRRPVIRKRSNLSAQQQWITIGAKCINFVVLFLNVFVISPSISV